MHRHAAPTGDLSAVNRIPSGARAVPSTRCRDATMKSTWTGVQVGRSSRRKSLESSIFGDRDPVHDPSLRCIVSECVMHGTSVVPYCHVAARPSKTDLVFRPNDVIEQETEETPCVGSRHSLDVDREARVAEQVFSSGRRVCLNKWVDGASHSGVRIRECRRLSVRFAPGEIVPKVPHVVNASDGGKVGFETGGERFVGRRHRKPQGIATDRRNRVAMKYRRKWWRTPIRHVRMPHVGVRNCNPAEFESHD